MWRDAHGQWARCHARDDGGDTTAMKPVRTLIAVADGQHARFFLHEGIGHGLKLAVDAEMATELPRNRDIVTDREGRAATPLGTKGRHTLAYTVDYHQFEKARFAHDVAEYIDAMRTKIGFDRLVLVAPPKTLGNLRESLTKPTRDLVYGELHKDLVHHDAGDIERALGQVMAV
jgi:protein required for attachment to host cells